MTAFDRPVRPLRGLTRPDGLFATLTFLGALALYVRTLAPGLVFGDGAEFQTLAYTLGMTHPTGYPIYLLIARLFTLLPFGDVAYRVNLMSAFFGALSAALLYLVGQMLGRSRLASLLGAALLATNWLFWWQAVMAELYTFGAAVLIGILLLVLVWRQSDSWRALFVAGLLGGLSIGIHDTVALAAPGILVYLLLAGCRRSAWLGALAGAGLGLGLMLAAFVLVGSVHTPASYYNTSLRFSLSALGVKPFRSAFDHAVFMLSAQPFQNRMFSNPGAVMISLTRLYWYCLRFSFSPAGIALVVIGVLGLLARRWREAYLILLSLAAVLGFALNYTITDIYVFFIPSYVFLTLLIGLGVDALQDGTGRLLRRFPVIPPPRRQLAARGVGLFFLLLAAGFLAPSVVPSVRVGHLTMLNGAGLPAGDQGPEKYPYPIHDPDRARRQARELVDLLDETAIVFDGWDQLYTHYYVAHVERGRTDLEFIELWDFGPLEAYQPLLRFLETIVERRPAYLSPQVAGYPGVVSTLSKHFRLEPVHDGKLWRITARKEAFDSKPAPAVAPAR